MKCTNNCCELEVKPYRHTFFFNKTKRKSGVFIYNPSSNTVLIVLSRNRLWGLPKGSLKDNETDEQCAIREVKEETGIEVDNNDFLYSVKINSNVVYFYMEIENQYQVNVQKSINTEANDVNGIGWIKLDCLEKMVNTGQIKLNRHGKIAFKKIKNLNIN